MPCYVVVIVNRHGTIRVHDWTVELSIIFSNVPEVWNISIRTTHTTHKLVNMKHKIAR